MPNKELRILRSLPVLKREGSKNLIVGYAARFNEWSHDLGGFRERIAPGAFSEALKDTNILGLYNHNPDHLLGRNGAGTMKTWEDSEGLMYEIDADVEQQFVSDLLRKLERKDLFGSSFSFRLRYDDTTWEWQEEEGSEELPSRTILRVEKIYDVGPVTQPAYPTTTTGIRSPENILQEFRDLHNSNMPKTGATWADDLQRLERLLHLA